jgi:hypothetical protein
MKLDNQRNTYRIWISRLITAIVFTMAIIVLIFLPWFDNPESFITKYHLIIVVAVIYIALNTINYLKRPYFIFFSDQGEMLIFRYYPLSLFTSKKHSVEIPKQQFVKYELKEFLFGSQKKIILYQHFRNRVAPYPPVSLSAVDREDVERILATLRKYMKHPDSQPAKD